MGSGKEGVGYQDKWEGGVKGVGNWEIKGWEWKIGGENWEK